MADEQGAFANEVEHYMVRVSELKRERDEALTALRKLRNAAFIFAAVTDSENSWKALDSAIANADRVLGDR